MIWMRDGGKLNQHHDVFTAFGTGIGSNHTSTLGKGRHCVQVDMLFDMLYIQVPFYLVPLFLLDGSSAHVGVNRLDLWELFQSRE